MWFEVQTVHVLINLNAYETKAIIVNNELHTATKTTVLLWHTADCSYCYKTLRDFNKT